MLVTMTACPEIHTGGEIIISLLRTKEAVDSSPRHAFSIPTTNKIKKIVKASAFSECLNAWRIVKLWKAAMLPKVSDKYFFTENLVKRREYIL